MTSLSSLIVPVELRAECGLMSDVVEFPDTAELRAPELSQKLTWKSHTCADSVPTVAFPCESSIATPVDMLEQMRVRMCVRVCVCGRRAKATSRDAHSSQAGIMQETSSGVHHSILTAPRVYVFFTTAAATQRLDRLFSLLCRAILRFGRIASSHSTRHPSS